MSTIALSDGRVLGVHTQPGVGTPMVLLHGLYENARSWAAFADASTRPCVAFDLPGFGASTLPRANANYGDYADAIAQGIAQLQLQDFEIIGHSFGGAVAAALAERELKSVRALTLVATCGFGRQHIPELLRAPALRTFMDITVPLALGEPVYCRRYLHGLGEQQQAPVREHSHAADARGRVRTCGRERGRGRYCRWRGCR
jgi:pimeloyl-ACP methyl ester carboxylesterase